MTLDEAAAAVDELERRYITRFGKEIVNGVPTTPWPAICGMLRANLYMALAGHLDGKLVCPGDGENEGQL